MKLTEAQRVEMQSAAMPLMVWLLNNCHPQVQAIVHNTQVELLEGLAMAKRVEHQVLDE